MGKRVKVSHAVLLAFLTNVGWGAVANADCGQTFSKKKSDRADNASELSTGALASVEIQSIASDATPEDAVEYYEKLLEDPNISNAERARFQLELARLFKSQGNLESAGALAKSAAEGAQNASLKAKALKLYASTARSLTIAGVERDLTVARQLRSEGRYLEARAALDRLAFVSCPYKTDFKDRVSLENARLWSSIGDLTQAKAALEPLMLKGKSRKVRSTALSILTKVNQLERDGLARSEIDEAEEVAESGQLKRAESILQSVRENYPKASTSVLVESEIAKARILRTRGRFDAAHESLEQAKEAWAREPRAAERLADEELRGSIEEAQRLADEGKAGLALTHLDALNQSGGVALHKVKVAAAKSQILLNSGYLDAAADALAQVDDVSGDAEASAALAAAKLKLAVSQAMARQDQDGPEDVTSAINAALAAHAREDKAAVDARLAIALVLAESGNMPQADRVAAALNIPERSDADAARLKIAQASARRAVTAQDLDGADQILTSAIQTYNEAPERVAAQAKVQLALVRSKRLGPVAGHPLVEPLLASEDSRVQQMGRDALLRIDLVTVERLADQGSFERAEAELQSAMARNPSVSEDALLEARLEPAYIAAASARFETARAVVASVNQPEADISKTKRIRQANSRIARLEADYRSKERVTAARSLARRGDFGGAMMALALITSDERTPKRWRQEASLRRIDLFIDESMIGAARNELQAIKEVGVEPSAQPRLRSVEDDLRHASAPSRWSGFLSLGAGYDTNTPARRSAARQEDEAAPYPLDKNLDDFSIRATGQAVYRKNIDDNGSHWRVAAGLDVIKQSDLTRLDSIAVDLEAGPVFHLPAARTFISPTVTYNREWRGGEFFGQEYGAKLSANSKYFRKKEVFGSVEYAYREDARKGFDGSYMEGDVGVAHYMDDGARIALEANLQRAQADAKEFRYWGPAVRLSYERELGQFANAPVKFGASAHVRFLDYDGVTSTASGPVGREDTRYRLDLGLSVSPKQNWDLNVGYEYFKQDSNIAGRSRDDHFFGISLKRRFGAE